MIGGNPLPDLNKSELDLNNFDIIEDEYYRPPGLVKVDQTASEYEKNTEKIVKLYRKRSNVMKNMFDQIKKFASKFEKKNEDILRLINQFGENDENTEIEIISKNINEFVNKLKEQQKINQDNKFLNIFIHPDSKIKHDIYDKKKWLNDAINDIQTENNKLYQQSLLLDPYFRDPLKSVFAPKESNIMFELKDDYFKINNFFDTINNKIKNVLVPKFTKNCVKKFEIEMSKDRKSVV